MIIFLFRHLVRIVIFFFWPSTRAVFQMLGFDSRAQPGRNFLLYKYYPFKAILQSDRLYALHIYFHRLLFFFFAMV